MRMTGLEGERPKIANKFVECYPEVFDEHLGCLSGTVHLEINYEATPVQLPVRRIPVALKD